MNGFADRTYAHIVSDNRRMRAPANGSHYRITILANVLVNPLLPLLEWMFLSEGLPTEITLANFDNIVQDSAAIDQTDAVIVFMDLAGIPAALADVGRPDVADGLSAAIAQTTKNLESVPLVLFNTFSALPYEGRALRARPLGALAARLNETLRAQTSPNLVALELGKVYAMVGIDRAIDFRQWHATRALHTLDFFKEWVEQAYPAFRSARGRARKVMVVDCDNTLWGGTIGEDGIDGIRLDDSTRDGPFFREAQLVLKGLQADGVLLAIASRNNREDVMRVLEHHPEMQLREHDFVALELGWSEKLQSLQRIAETLHLTVDSFVFLDDSPFELDRIRTSLPQVYCVQVPELISDYPRVLRDSLGLFFNLSTSEEDSKRTALYRQEVVRETVLASSHDQDEYLASLNVQVEFSEGAAVDVARAAQLSQKTNQFNLTTRRYTEADLARMLDDPYTIVATFSVSDRYGAYGRTGLVILNLDVNGASASLDTFLMSCRVLGRKVEITVMDWIRRRVVRAGRVRVHAEYRPTKGNPHVADLLDQLGFERVCMRADRTLYALELGPCQIS